MALEPYCGPLSARYLCWEETGYTLSHSSCFRFCWSRQLLPIILLVCSYWDFCLDGLVGFQSPSEMYHTDTEKRVAVSCHWSCWILWYVYIPETPVLSSLLVVRRYACAFPIAQYSTSIGDRTNLSFRNSWASFGTNNRRIFGFGKGLALESVGTTLALCACFRSPVLSSSRNLVGQYSSSPCISASKSNGGCQSQISIRNNPATLVG